MRLSYVSRHSKPLFVYLGAQHCSLLSENRHSFRFPPFKYPPRPLARPFRIPAEAAESTCGALYGRASFYGSVAGSGLALFYPIGSEALYGSVAGKDIERPVVRE